MIAEKRELCFFLSFQYLMTGVLRGVRSIPVEHTELFGLVQVQVKAQQEVLQQHCCTPFLHPCSTRSLHHAQSFSPI